MPPSPESGSRGGDVPGHPDVRRPNSHPRWYRRGMAGTVAVPTFAHMLTMYLDYVRDTVVVDVRYRAGSRLTERSLGRHVVAAQS